VPGSASHSEATLYAEVQKQNAGSQAQSKGRDPVQVQHIQIGSGIYQPRQSGYIDMDPDFMDYLETYAKDFQTKLREYLEKQK